MPKPSMPKPPIRTRHRTFLYVLSGILLVALALIVALRRWDRFQTDEILAGWFCLGTPLLLLGSALLIAAWSDPKRRRGKPGFCPRCGEWMGGMDLFCPQCGSSAVAWAVPPRMKTWRASRINWERPVHRRIAPKKDVAITAEVRAAAECMVMLSLAPTSKRQDLIMGCLADSATARRVYHVAARRLHPDSNHGDQLEEWDRLQAAMAILKVLHREE